MLNDEILEKYIQSFFGYGNLNSDYWFVSLEEGGNNSEEDIQKRLNIWKKRGSKQLEDCKSFHLEFGTEEHKKWFGFDNKKYINPRLQSTWRNYIRLFFYATKNKKFIEIQDETKQKEIMRRFQRDNFGSLNGDMAIMELRPLPARSTSKKHWIYNSVSKIDYLKDKDTYIRYIDNLRIKKLKEFVDKYNPKYVVFFSTSKEIKPKWLKIIDTKINENLDLGFCFFETKRNGTNYFIIEHAVAKDFLINSNGDRKKGLGNDYFNKVGQYISNI